MVIASHTKEGCRLRLSRACPSHRPDIQLLMPWGDLRATAKRIAARRREEAEPKGQTPFPSPNWRLRRSARLGRSVLKAQSEIGVGPSRPPQGEAAMYTVHVLGIDGVWREYHVFASRAAAERSVIGFEAEGFRAKIYRTAAWPLRRTQMFKAIIIAGTLGK